MPNWLTDMRKSRGHTLCSMADAIGSNKASISNAESGKTAPSPDLLARISQFFGVPQEEIREKIGMPPATTASQCPPPILPSQQKEHVAALVRSALAYGYVADIFENRPGQQREFPSYLKDESELVRFFNVVEWNLRRQSAECRRIGLFGEMKKNLHKYLTDADREFEAAMDDMDEREKETVTRALNARYGKKHNGTRKTRHGPTKPGDGQGEPTVEQK